MEDKDREFYKLLDDYVKVKDDLSRLHADFLKYMRGDDITNTDKYWTGFNHAAFKAAIASLNMVQL